MSFCLSFALHHGIDKTVHSHLSTDIIDSSDCLITLHMSFDSYVLTRHSFHL